MVDTHCHLDRCEPPVDEELERAIERMIFVLWLDDDVSEFFAAFKRDPLIGAAIHRKPWIRPRRRPWAWEALVWAITEQLIDFIRTTVVHGGGISPLRKIAALAEIYHVRTGCHGATDLSPVCMAAALHFGLSVHNFGIQEHMPHGADTDRVFPHQYTYQDGYMHPGEGPGLGVEIDETLAAQYPYDPAYLPVNRKLDGTLHSW